MDVWHSDDVGELVFALSVVRECSSPSKPWDHLEVS